MVFVVGNKVPQIPPDTEFPAVPVRISFGEFFIAQSRGGLQDFGPVLHELPDGRLRGQ
ncbi:hypothetical protein D3C81_2275360 [compost metagenome]